MADMNRNTETFFQRSLEDADAAIHMHISQEQNRQGQQIELIASENIVSQAVLQAQGSVLTNKYAEGYPGRRYYGGCEYVDRVETIAIERAKELFSANFANVQPNSGSQANQSVLLALVKPGETILGLSLDAGGHLTHGARPNLSGKWFQAEQYGLDANTDQIDMDRVLAKAKQVKPSLIIAGGSAYPRALDFAGFRRIADEVGAKLMVDMAHIAGLVAAGYHDNPLPHAHVVTTTTHKTLRGPRGGMVLTNDEIIAKKINSAIFPGLQGGPLMHVIAAKAVAFGEALRPEFKTYIRAVIDNCQQMAAVLEAGGYSLVSGGTDTHLALVDLRPKGLTGKAAEAALERAFITCNKNGVPNDPQKPTITSGIRIGSPAATTRGFGRAEFIQVGQMMVEVLDALVQNPKGNLEVEERVRERVLALTRRFPIYRS
ncbi:MAG: serine hydroxymethyltransferase [Robiginitomaculum sp.]|nr:MAG: serine hydroxymethyltransferase [Robiginitomaculum sp.]